MPSRSHCFLKCLSADSKDSLLLTFTEGTYISPLSLFGFGKILYQFSEISVKKRDKKTLPWLQKPGHNPGIQTFREGDRGREVKIPVILHLLKYCVHFFYKFFCLKGFLNIIKSAFTQLSFKKSFFNEACRDENRHRDIIIFQFPYQFHT